MGGPLQQVLAVRMQRQLEDCKNFKAGFRTRKVLLDSGLAVRSSEDQELLSWEAMMMLREPSVIPRKVGTVLVLRAQGMPVVDLVQALQSRAKREALKPLQESKCDGVAKGEACTRHRRRRFGWTKPCRTLCMCPHSYSMSVSPSATVNVSRNVRLSFVSFDGHDYYHATRKFFHAQQSAHLLVWNGLVKRSDELDAYMRTLRARAPHAPIIVVIVYSSKYVARGAVEADVEQHFRCNGAQVSACGRDSTTCVQASDSYTRTHAPVRAVRTQRWHNETVLPCLLR